MGLSSVSDESIGTSLCVHLLHAMQKPQEISDHETQIAHHYAE